MTDPLAGLSPEAAAALAAATAHLEELRAKNDALKAQLAAAGVEDPVTTALKELHPRCTMACSRLPRLYGPALLPTELSFSRNAAPERLAGNRPAHPKGPGLYIWLRGYRLGSSTFNPTRSASRRRGKGLADTGKPESAGNPPNRL